MLKQQLNRKYKATSTYIIILVLNFMGFSTILSNLFGIVEALLITNCKIDIGQT